MSDTRRRTWNELFPGGRFVYFEGDDPASFAHEMASLGIDVGDEFFEPDGYDADGEESSSYGFFIPAGRVEEIYGSGDWVLGS